MIKQWFTKQAHLPYIGPISLWFILFVFTPLGVILYFSFLSVGPLGNIIPTFTLENYLALFKGAYGKIFLRSLLFAFGANMICLVLGYPLAYWIVEHGGRWKIVFLLLVVLPSWTCYIIRLYALKTLMGSAGLINSALLNLGLVSSPLGILYNPYAVLFGLVYSWIPFMVLPIYASLDGLDHSLLEAAVDLGATPFRRFLTVTLPLTKGGIYAGSILVFGISLGEWLVPLFLGGAKVMMAGNLVAHHFITLGDVPAGSGIAAVLAALVILLMYLGIKLAGEEALEKIV